MSKPFFTGLVDSVTTRTAAFLLGVSLRTVQLWCDQGKLTYRATPGGHRRIPLESIANLLTEMSKEGGGLQATRVCDLKEKLLSANKEKSAVEDWQPGSICVCNIEGHPAFPFRPQPESDGKTLRVAVWILEPSRSEVFLNRLRNNSPIWGGAILRSFGVTDRRIITGPVYLDPTKDIMPADEWKELPAPYFADSTEPIFGRHEFEITVENPETFLLAKLVDFLATFIYA